MLSARDRDYIEARLIAPCTEALDAHERLVKAGEVEAARKLMEAIKVFTDECRSVRRVIVDVGNIGIYG